MPDNKVGSGLQDMGFITLFITISLESRCSKPVSYFKLWIMPDQVFKNGKKKLENNK